MLYLTLQLNAIHDHLQKEKKALKGIAKFDKIIKYGLQIR